MDVKEMKGGYTTGSCATAGMKAALMALLSEEEPSAVEVENPQGEFIRVPIKAVEVLSVDMAKAVVIKDAGDDPDVTHGTSVETTVKLLDEPGLVFRAGKGVGRVTKPGLALPPGEPAINPGPRKMMDIVYQMYCPEGKGVEVTVSVPAGEELAKHTLNETLGIIGGIGIIGTSGIVKPMSEEAFKDSLVPQLQVIKACGHETAILVPGRIGQTLAEKILRINKEQMAETSNFMGFMLEQSVKEGFKKIVVIGHLGKIVKLASGSFHTHNRMSDGRIETMVAYAGLEGADVETLHRIMDCQTTEAIMPIITEKGLEAVYKRVAERASLRSMRYIAQQAKVGIVLSTLGGEILAMSETAKQIGEEDGWNIPSTL